VREDCFAYEETNGIARCNALKKNYCKKGICNFYKTREQVDRELEKCEKRLHELGGIDTTKGYISTKRISEEKKRLLESAQRKNIISLL